MYTTLAFVCSAWFANAQTASPLTPGNILIYRVGDGSKTLSTAAFPVFLDERSISLEGILLKQAPVKQSIKLPATKSDSDTLTGGNHLLTASGTGTTEGQLTRSSDGNYVVFGGYNSGSDTSTASVSASPSATTARVIGRIDGNATINTTTACTNLFSAYAIRSVVSQDGNTFIACGGSAGIKYANLGATSSNFLSDHTTTNNTQSPTARSLEIIDGQLFASYQSTFGKSDTALTMATVGVGVDTAKGEKISVLPGIDTVSASFQDTISKYPSLGLAKKLASPYQFTILHLDGGPVLYIADNGTNDSVAERGILKYSLVGGSWNYNGAIHANGITGITGANQGDSVLLIATEKTKLFASVDLTGWNNAPIDTAAWLIDTALANTQFRGVAFTPGIPSGLPVVVKSFTGSLINGYAKLTWATSNESNIRGYEIEKSSDSKNFTSIGGVAANNKPSSYTFTDQTKVDGVEYYRLKITNNDGSFIYSSIVSLNDKVGIKLGVYPNPVVSTAIISHPEATSNTSLKIIAINGKTIATYPVQTGATETSVDVSRLVKGSYLVSFESNNKSLTTQFVK